MFARNGDVAQSPSTVTWGTGLCTPKSDKSPKLSAHEIVRYIYCICIMRIEIVLKKAVITSLFLLCGIMLRAQVPGEAQTLNETDENGLRQGYWKITGAISQEDGYRNDRVVEEGKYEDGRRTDLWRKFYPTGTVRSEITYVNDFPRGLYRVYYPSGKVEEEGEWQGMKNVNAFRRYHENGRIAQDFHFNSKGRRDGTQRYYYASGQPQLTVEVENGLSHGLYQTYYADGSLKEQKQIISGRVDPESIVHYAPVNGQLASESGPELPKGEIVLEPETNSKETIAGRESGSSNQPTMEKFEKTGPGKLYNHNNQVTQEGEFRHGRLWNGKWHRYDREGNVSKTEVYQHGKFVGYELPQGGS